VQYVLQGILETAKGILQERISGQEGTLYQHWEETMMTQNLTNDRYDVNFISTHVKLVPQCTLEGIFGEHSKETELLRYIRDDVLSQTPVGREIIRLYYQLSPVIVMAMEKDEEFKEEVKELLPLRSVLLLLFVHRCGRL